MKILIVLAFLVCTLVASAQNAPPAAPAPVPVPAAGVPPSPGFLADIETFIQLVGQVSDLEKKAKATKEWKVFQDTVDRANGMQLRISQQIPKGYQFDPKSKLLIPVPVAPSSPVGLQVEPKPVPPASAPTPAVSAPEDKK